MSTFEIMQKVEVQTIEIERARSVMMAITELIESECMDIPRGEQLLNLSCVADNLLFNALPELQKVVKDLELKFKADKLNTSN